MLVYNITLKVEWIIQQEWLQWMNAVYIPAILKTNCFMHHQLLRLLEVDEEEGPTYALQFFASNKEDYNHYISHFLPKIERMSYEKWNNGVLSFSTLMEVVEKE